MEKLLESLTRAANAVASYYESLASGRHHPTSHECHVAARTEYERYVRAKENLVNVKVSSKGTLEKTAAPAPAPVAAPAEPPAAPKRAAGRPKKTPPAPAAAPQDLLSIDPEYAALTDAESAKRIFEVGEQLIEAYPKLGAAGPDGEPAPEGFHMVVAALKDKFGVERLAKLTHTQRLQFMSLMKAKLVSAPAAPAGVGTEDPNAGI